MSPETPQQFPTTETCLMTHPLSAPFLSLPSLSLVFQWATCAEIFLSGSVVEEPKLRQQVYS